MWMEETSKYFRSSDTQRLNRRWGQGRRPYWCTTIFARTGIHRRGKKNGRMGYWSLFSNMNRGADIQYNSIWIIVHQSWILDWTENAANFTSLSQVGWLRKVSLSVNLLTSWSEQSPLYGYGSFFWWCWWFQKLSCVFFNVFFILSS